MYRHADEPHEPNDRVELPRGQGARKFAPVPLGLISSIIALSAEFFGLFLLAWGMAPTSIGCSATRAASMLGVQLAIAVEIFAVVSVVGLGIMRDARESQLRRLSFVLTF